MALQMAYDMVVPRTILMELKTRIPPILSAVVQFAEKYQIKRLFEDLKTTAVTRLNELYDTVSSYALQMSNLSVFFRNTIVPFQRAVQDVIDAVVKFLRETKFTLPWSHQLTTIPEVLREVTSSVAAVLENIIQQIYVNAQFYYNAFVEMILSVNLSMPVSDALASNQFLAEVKKAIKMFFDDMVDFVKNMESLDNALVKLGETLSAVVDKTQEFVDSVESDYLDVFLGNINEQYRNFIVSMQNVVFWFASLTMDDVKDMCENVIDTTMYVTVEVNKFVSDFLQQTSQSYVTIRGRTLEIEVPFAFQQ